MLKYFVTSFFLCICAAVAIALKAASFPQGRCDVESAFAPYVGFGVLMTSKLGTNVILMRYVAAISPMKESKS
jgi:hypothetical protein